MTDEQTDKPAQDRTDHDRSRLTPGVTIHCSEHRPTIRVVAHVDPAKITDVSTTINGLLAVKVRELLVDLTNAYDAAGLLSVLAAPRRDLLDQDRTLRVIGIALPELLPALSSAPLDEVFLVCDAVRRNTSPRRRARSTMT